MDGGRTALNKTMTRKEVIQEMQMCLKCSPYFERKEGVVLAHEVGSHIKLFDDGYTTVTGERVSFTNHIMYGDFKTPAKKHRS